MIESADKGDRNSIYYVAKAFDTGFGLSKNRYLIYLFIFSVKNFINK
jgi:hypothetical protein